MWTMSGRWPAKLNRSTPSLKGGHTACPGEFALASESASQAAIASASECSPADVACTSEQRMTIAKARIGPADVVPYDKRRDDS